ncbi:MAG: peptide deformylase [Candidatus Acidiferrales bacterium]
MSLTIVQAGEPVLRQVARDLTKAEIESDQIQSLILDMRETMHGAPGVGLAAPQVGLPLQLAMIEDKEEHHKSISAEDLRDRERQAVPFQVIINPKITHTSGSVVEFFEGCLSLPGFSAIVPRAHTVTVECLDENGRQKLIVAAGWHARILQHEIDHLNGNLYIDRMRSRTFMLLDNYNRYWKGRPIKEIQSTLG